MNKKVTISIIILIFVALAIIFWITKPASQNQQISQEETQEQQETTEEKDKADWETYKNEEFGIEFQYPQGVEIRDIEKYRDEHIRVSLNSQTEKFGSVALMSFTVNKKPKNIEEMKENSEAQSDNAGTEIVTFRELPALKSTTDSRPGAPLTEFIYFIEYNKGIGISYPIEALPDNSSIIEQILPTLKVTE